MLSIINASYLGNYRIALAFNNGAKGIANLKEVIFNDKRDLFVQLQSETQFQQFKIEHDTLIWTNGLDLAPEFLFFISFKQEASWQEKFKQWGYV